MNIKIFYSLLNNSDNIIVRDCLSQFNHIEIRAESARTVKSTVLEEIQRDQEACWRIGLKLNIELSSQLIEEYFENVLVIVREQFNNNSPHDKTNFSLFMSKNSNWPLAYSLPVYDAIQFYLNNS